MIKTSEILNFLLTPKVFVIIVSYLNDDFSKKQLLNLYAI